VVVADLSGIELRVNHFLWREQSSMALFKADPEKADLYKDFASKLYDKSVDDVTKQERQVGKVAHLGLGFGAGGKTFQSVAKLMGGVDLTEAESYDVVNRWRAAYPLITQGWKTCHAALDHIYHGHEGIPIDPAGLCKTAKGGIKTPQGMIRYPDLRVETDKETGKREWVYGNGRRKARIYAGKVTENIVQHLAREALSDMMLKIQQRYQIVHTVHDEVILVVPDAEAQEALDFMQNIMRQGVDWWPELVTWSEGDIADTYGDAK
jgi:DNA polymerase I-like protein with 3'-5' exonuclease and polymerase domains